MEIFLLQVVATVGALLPITNPFSAAPAFVGLTRGFADVERQRQARRATVYMASVLLGALFSGAIIMQFFGITVPVMRIAGGIVVARVGFGMSNPEPEQQVSEASKLEAKTMRDIAFTPIAMPLLSGPGSIAVTIGLATHADNVVENSAVAAGIILVAVIAWLVLRSSIKVVHYLSETGMNVLTRLMGFILICIGIEFISTGLFEALTDPEIIGPIVKTVLSMA
jgi:multiple antibiotic resistance protein